jgi:predicted glycosyltransferase
MRNIMYEGPRLRQVWERDGAYELLDELYDLILVYGQAKVYDLAREADLSSRAALKVRQVGYLRRGPAARPPEQVRAELGLQTDRLVLVTGGGGADGFPILRCVLEAVARPEAARFDWLLVGGPLMPIEDRRRLRELVPSGVPVRFVDWVEDLVDYVAAADVVVSRAGYNTVCEILSVGRPAVLIPRVEVDGRADHAEQRLRAEALSRRGLARMIHPVDLTPDRLIEAIEDLLDRPLGPAQPLDLDGLPNLTAELAALLARRPPARDD